MMHRAADAEFLRLSRIAAISILGQFWAKLRQNLNSKLRHLLRHFKAQFTNKF